MNILYKVESICTVDFYVMCFPATWRMALGEGAVSATHVCVPRFSHMIIDPMYVNLRRHGLRCYD